MDDEKPSPPLEIILTKQQRYELGLSLAEAKKYRADLNQRLRAQRHEYFTSGEVAQRRGVENELRLGNIFESLRQQWPAWLVRVVKASRGQWGYDYTFVTEDNIGVLVDVKSSFGGLRGERKDRRNCPERRGIVLVVVNPRRTDQEIFSELIEKIQNRRQGLLASVA